MNEKILKNPLALTGLLLLTSIVLGAVLHFVGEWLNIKYLSGLSAIIAALLVGKIYISKFKEVMDKKLRLKVSSIYIGIQFVLGVLFGLLLGIELKMLLTILIIISAIFFFAVYYFLASGGKAYLKAIKRQEELKKKK